MNQDRAVCSSHRQCGTPLRGVDAAKTVRSSHREECGATLRPPTPGTAVLLCCVLLLLNSMTATASELNKMDLFVAGQS